MPPMANYYVADFSTQFANYIQSGRADGWNEVVLTSRTIAKFVLAAGPGSIRGKVSGANQDAVLGAPVFLEAWDAGQRRRLLDLRTVRTDVQGNYYFAGLAPGVYRVLSSFEFQEPDETAMATARTIQMEQGKAAVQDLDLYVMR